MKRTLAALLMCAGLAACSDGATRLAYQIESEASSFQRSRDATYTIVHRPVHQNNNGCADAYRLQVDKVGAIIIWCIDGKSGATTHSHSTSYHARFVDTAQTWIVDKKAGEATYIELKKSGDKPVVVNVR